MRWHQGKLCCLPQTVQSMQLKSGGDTCSALMNAKTGSGWWFHFLVAFAHVMHMCQRPLEDQRSNQSRMKFLSRNKTTMSCNIVDLIQ